MPKSILGLQLYSLRREFDTDAEGTLRQVKNLGYDYIETAGTYGWSAEQWKKLLAETGLKVAGAHMAEADLTTGLDKQIELQKALGNHRFILAYIPEEGRTVEGYKKTAKILNKAAGELSSQGGKVLYHNHDFEFKALGGTTGYEILLKETDPELVSFEVDTYWVELSGQHAAKFMAEHESRIGMIHAKELRHSDKSDQVAGKGDVDFPSILMLAEKNSWPVIVEFEGEGAVESSRQSAEYLGAIMGLRK